MRGAQIALLHLVSIYILLMGMPSSPWDDFYFASKGELTCGAVVCTNWITIILHQIGALLYVPTAHAIDSDLASDPKLDPLETFTADNSDVDSIIVRNMIYLPAPYVGIFLVRKITPDKAWRCL